MSDPAWYRCMAWGIAAVAPASTQRRPAGCSTGRACRRSPTASARIAHSNRACWRRLSARRVPGVAKAANARQRRFHHRVARRRRDHGRRADVLPGAHRQRIVSAHRDERRSILELARLIGYELHPGVAASTFLAFTLDDTPGAPAQTIHRHRHPGAKHSRPGRKTADVRDHRKNRSAGRVERADAAAVRGACAGIRRPLFYLKGIATNLKTGRRDFARRQGTGRQSGPGANGISAGSARLLPTPKANRTRIEWAEGLGTTSPHKVLPAAEPKIYALTNIGPALFGFNAPHPKTLSDQTLEALWPGSNESTE